MDRHLGLTISLTDAQAQTITDAVVEVESQTAGEFVVVLRAQSGSYLDLGAYAGAAGGLLMICFAVFNPWTVHSPVLLPFEFVIAFVLVCLGVHVSPLLCRLLSTKERRREQAVDGALAAFVKEGVSETLGRTGVLVYVSQLERRVEVIADVGVLEAVDDQAWRDLIDNLAALQPSDDPVEASAECVRQLGAFLAEPLPVGEGDVNELPDRPRAHV